MTTGFHNIELEENGGRIVTLTFMGKVDAADYELFVPQLEGLLKQEKPVRILVELREFQGWTAGALWEDTKFGARHFNDIDRLAVVGDRRWEQGLTAFIKPFISAEVRYFDSAEMDAARTWLLDH
jgi:hypothetical protein